MNCRERMTYALVELYSAVKDRILITKIEEGMAELLLLECLNIWESRQ